MAEFSQYKKLELPKSNEHYDICVVNKNNRIIDSELHKLDLKNESQDELLATKESLNFEIDRATQAEQDISGNLQQHITETAQNFNVVNYNISSKISKNDLFVINEQTLSFNENSICNIVDSRITEKSLAEVFFTNDTIDIAADANIQVDTYDGYVSLVAENQPTDDIKATIQIMVVSNYEG